MSKLTIIENHNSSNHDGGVAVYHDGQILALSSERVDGIKHSRESSPAFDHLEPRIGHVESGVHNFYNPKYTPVQPINHALAHAASAFYPSGFDDAAVLVIDGQGYHKESTVVSTSVWLGVGHELEQAEIVERPAPFCDNSLGHFYSAVTYYLGFGFYDQGKTMALASYGKPSRVYRRLEKYCRPFMGTVQTTDADFIRYVFLDSFGSDFGWEEPADLKQKLRLYRKNLGSMRQGSMAPIGLSQFNLAWGAQRILEDSIVAKCGQIADKYGARRLCLAGGVALNVAANTRIVEECGFDEVFIQPAAGDDGQALGKLLYRMHNDFGLPRTKQVSTFRGPEYSRCEYEAALSGFRKLVDVEEPGSTRQLARRVAREIARHKIVAVCRGQSELGPRALGHRSILADPRLPGMRHILNAQVKHREFFQPFAIAILEAQFREYFHGPALSPYMLLVGRAREAAFEKLPAAIHVDGTCRIQTVGDDDDLFLKYVLEEFARLTGVHAVINTSFNDAGQPIVETPSQALNTFLKMDVDQLVFGDRLLTRRVRRTTRA